MVLGVNALALFFLSSFVARLLIVIKVPGDTARTSLHGWLYGHMFAPWASPVNASLAYAIAYLALWLGVLWLLERSQIRLTV